MLKITEQNSNYNSLESMSTLDLLTNINKEDATVADAVQKIIPALQTLVDAVVKAMKNGGRLFYIGAGTSGRLGIVDASECPPTFGIEHDMVIGIIAGGDVAIRKAVEFAEDNTQQGYMDLQKYNITNKDCVIGIAASGTTPYVIGAVSEARAANILTGCITCNASSPLAKAVEFPIEIIVGPEFVTGSTRMKSGTAQKLVLNMLSTAVMIKLGKVKGNKMVDMQLSNNKLIERGIKMLMDALKLDENSANSLLLKHGSVRKAIQFFKMK